MSHDVQKFRFQCTLTFGDIYGQIIVWLIVIFISLGTSLALWSSTRQIYALATVGLILVLSLPFLLFAFVTTLFNHIEIKTIAPEETTETKTGTSPAARKSVQKPAEATG